MLIQSHGLSSAKIHAATKEVAQTLGSFAAEKGANNLDGSGDNAPAFALGQAKVLHGRYMVTYRLVNALYIMIVTEPHTNAFVCVHLLEAITKVLVAASKGVDVTADKISRRYSEVYSLLDGLLNGGLAVLPPAFAHRSATADILLVMPASATDAAHKLKKIFQASKSGGSSVPDTGTDPTPLPVPETPVSTDGRQLIAEEVDPLAKLAFNIPADALPPPPSRAAIARNTPQQLQPNAVAAPTAFEGALKTEKEMAADTAAAAAEALRQAGLAAPEAIVKEDGWAEFSEEQPCADSSHAAPQVQEPVLSDKDVRDSLHLLEIWHGEFASDKLVKCGVEGQVRLRLAPYGLSRAQFRVRPSTASIVNTCMRVAQLNAQCAEKKSGEEEDGFVASIARVPVGCSYLKYSLPAVACKPPLQLALHAFPGADLASGNQSGHILIVLRFIASPYIRGALLDAKVDLKFPPQFEQLVKVSPSCQWAKDQCQLRWEISRIMPGQHGLLQAVLSTKHGELYLTALDALHRQLTARVILSGQRGRSLSGLSLEVGLESHEPEFNPGSCQYFAEITAKL